MSSSRWAASLCNSSRLAKGVYIWMVWFKNLTSGWDPWYLFCCGWDIDSEHNLILYHSKDTKKLFFASLVSISKVTVTPYSAKSQEIKQDCQQHWSQRENEPIPPQLLPQNAPVHWCQLKVYFSKLHFFVNLVFLRVWLGALASKFHRLKLLLLPALIH